MRGFGLPPEYLGKKKQPEISSYIDREVDIENEERSKGSITNRLDEREVRHDEREVIWHWESRSVQEPEFKKLNDHRARGRASESGLHSKSRGNRFLSNGNSPSRGWYSGTTNDMNEKNKFPVEHCKDSPVKVLDEPQLKDAQGYSKQPKGKKGLHNVDETFQFHVPEFLNFRFDTEALIKTLPPETVF